MFMKTRIKCLLLSFAYLSTSCDAMAWSGEERDRWPDDTIVYQDYQDDYQSDERQAIDDVITEFQTQSCVKFKEKTSADEAYLVWRKKDENRCSSSTGRNGREQDVSLGPSCRNKLDILHETSHVAGFQHEHQRADRDPYVKIIQNEARNFGTREELDLKNASYDLTSIMHYGHQAMFTTVDPAYQKTMAVSNNFSFYDVMALNRAYFCAKSCPGWTKSKRPCRTHSFMDKNCKCQCSSFARKLADPGYKPNEPMEDRIMSLVKSDESRTVPCETSAVAFPKSENNCGCDDGWSRLNDNCYGPQENIEMTWQEAVQACESKNAKLTSSMDKTENDFLTQIMPCKNGYVGWLNAKTEGQGNPWKWMDTNEEISENAFKPFWRKDWPSSESGGATCLTLHRDGWWADSGCELKSSAVCKKPSSAEFPCKNSNPDEQIHDEQIHETESTSVGNDPDNEPAEHKYKFTVKACENDWMQLTCRKNLIEHLPEVFENLGNIEILSAVYVCIPSDRHNEACRDKKDITRLTSTEGKFFDRLSEECDGMPLCSQRINNNEFKWVDPCVEDRSLGYVKVTHTCKEDTGDQASGQTAHVTIRVTSSAPLVAVLVTVIVTCFQ